MKTKNETIKAIIAFGKNTVDNTAFVNDGVVSVVVIVYSPSELGASDDCWHHVINMYTNCTDGMMRFAETPCTNSIVINRPESMSVKDYVAKIEKEFIEFASGF